MHLAIRGHHLSVTPAIEEKIKTHFSKLLKQLDQICSVQVILEKKHRLTARSHKGQENHTAEIILRLPGRELFAQASADDMYAAISAVSEKLRRQIERHKKLKLAA